MKIDYSTMIIDTNDSYISTKKSSMNTLIRDQSKVNKRSQSVSKAFITDTFMPS